MSKPKARVKAKSSPKRGGRYAPKRKIISKPSAQSLKDADQDLTDFYEKMALRIEKIVAPDGFQAWLGWTEPGVRSNYSQCVTTQNVSNIIAKFFQDVLKDMLKACNAESKKYEKVNGDQTVQGFSHWLPAPESVVETFTNP